MRWLRPVGKGARARECRGTPAPPERAAARGEPTAHSPRRHRPVASGRHTLPCGSPSSEPSADRRARRQHRLAFVPPGPFVKQHAAQRGFTHLARLTAVLSHYARTAYEELAAENRLWTGTSVSTVRRISAHHPASDRAHRWLCTCHIAWSSKVSPRPLEVRPSCCLGGKSEIDAGGW